jgi:hypothetical protein
VLSGTGNCSYPAPPADGLFVALAMNTGNPLASVQVETAPGRWDDLARAVVQATGTRMYGTGTAPAPAAPVSQVPRQAPVTPAREPRRPAPAPSC